MILDIIYVLIIIFMLSTALKFKTKNNDALTALFIGFSAIFFILLIYNLIFKTTFLAIVIVLYIIIIRHIGAKKYYNLVVKELEFSSDKITEDIELVYVADFQHDYKEDVYNEKMANLVIDAINQQTYDVLLLGGDYINYNSHYEEFNNNIADINNRKLAFGVWGNHDLPFKEELGNIFSRHNIKMLTNEHAEIKIRNQKITISGVDDFWTGKPDFDAIKLKLNEDLLHINLIHNPDYFDKIKREHIDLALGGHYHGGQVIPLRGLPMQRIVTKYVYGLFTSTHAKMFVTSGCGGSWGRGRFGGFLRFNSKPEIVKIKFTPSR